MINILELTTALRDMDRQQQLTDHDGGREIAWYYWREQIETILGLPPGALDSQAPDTPQETTEQQSLREQHARLVADAALLDSTAELYSRLNRAASASLCRTAALRVTAAVQLVAMLRRDLGHLT